MHTFKAIVVFTCVLSLFQVGCSMSQNRESSKPVVVSTWKFGLKANEAAWQVLSAGGRALDAFETGVRVTEDDLNNRVIASKSKL